MKIGKKFEGEPIPKSPEDRAELELNIQKAFEAWQSLKKSGALEKDIQAAFDLFLYWLDQLGGTYGEKVENEVAKKYIL